MERKNRSTFIYTEKNTFRTNSSMSALLYRINDPSFVQVHKQFAVNKNYVSKKIHQGSGRYLLFLSDSEDTEIPSGRKYLDNVKRIFSQTGHISI